MELRTSSPGVCSAMGVGGVVVAVLVVADLVDVFPLTKCLNVGVGITLVWVLGWEPSSLRTAVSYSQRSSSQSMSDVASYSSRSGKGGCSRDEAKGCSGGSGSGAVRLNPSWALGGESE